MHAVANALRAREIMQRGATVLTISLLLTGLLALTAGCRSAANDVGGAASGAVQQQNQRQERLQEENAIIDSASKH